MVGSKGVLGILVHSDRHFEYVVKLAAAASAQGRQVKIHLLDKGVALLSTDSLRPLSRVARISACAEAVQAAPAAASHLMASVEIVAPQHLAALLQSFDRILVF